MNHSGELRVPEDVYEMRRERFERLMKLKAPRIILAHEAELFLRCFKWSWREWWSSWRMHHFPCWVLWLTDADYREACRDDMDESFECEMIKKLNSKR